MSVDTKSIFDSDPLPVFGFNKNSVVNIFVHQKLHQNISEIAFIGFMYLVSDYQGFTLNIHRNNEQLVELTINSGPLDYIIILDCDNDYLNQYGEHKDDILECLFVYYYNYTEDVPMFHKWLFYFDETDQSTSDHIEDIRITYGHKLSTITGIPYQMLTILSKTNCLQIDSSYSFDQLVTYTKYVIYLGLRSLRNSLKFSNPNNLSNVFPSNNWQSVWMYKQICLLLGETDILEQIEKYLFVEKNEN